MNAEISEIKNKIQNKIQESFKRIKKIKEQNEISINLKIREELDKTDESLAKKKDEFIKNINLFKLQIAKNIDNGIINYSELLIKKISSEEPNKNSLVEIFNKIKA